ncbi:MAG: lipopolysaccharide heptosyltransferase I [Thiothrix sp.]|uniref:lipopolysaccharide heptosyltransferase I n=1 Tax=Thiothrix sp. TaxID=1032 RepID=UPI0026099126|nr:lipopolysaccharide heptosyltransferase I [Thiothrix sp.]MDD5394644.1 lipopolysaccharide heptosyltransferase I [Thiothrix sp.]
MSNARKLLIIKTSSLGDVVHMLPAVTDALQQQPDLLIDWVVEEGFAEVPSWHPGIRRVIPLALRRWRKTPFAANTKAEIKQFLSALKQEQYDYVLDTQGLLKSALIACLSSGERYGYDWHSIREPLASLCYQHHATVSRQQHAVTRNRLLTAAALGYAIDDMPLAYGISLTTFPNPSVELPEKYIVALHGTSRPAKEWAETHWQMLIQTIAERGIHTLLPWGNVRECERAERLAQQQPYAQVLPRCGLGELAYLLQHAQGVIGMDTGLMHIASALDQRGLALYPVTAPELTGVMGNNNAQTPITTLAGEATADAAIIVQRFSDLLET